MENLWGLSGVLIVIIGFALKLDAILIVMAAMLATSLLSSVGFVGMLELLGQTFVSNRGMAIFILIMLVTGTLERNGLKQSAANLIKKLKNLSAGSIVNIYGFFRMIFAAFNISFGGVAGFVRPVIMPMIDGTVDKEASKDPKEYEEEMKGISSAMENICWFFGQVLFIGGPGALLVQSTLKELGYEVSLTTLAAVEIPVAIFALIVASIYFYKKERKLREKYKVVQTNDKS